MTGFLTVATPQSRPLLARLLAMVCASTLGGAIACRHLLSSPKTCARGDGLQELAYTGGAMPTQTLTFVVDGGPTAATATLGDILAAQGAQATFFVDGVRVADATETLARLKTRGHLIGNRTYSGASLRRAPDPVTEVRKADELIAPYVSGDIFLLRAPADDFDVGLAQRLNDAGLSRYVGPIGADIRPSCASTESADACAQTAIEAIRLATRGIVAFDATQLNTGEMLRILLPKLKAEGFVFQRLDQVSLIKEALTRSGARPGTIGGDGGCQEYSE